jgi:glycosyltransferase involved in cell wall biosynthesis
MKILFLTPWYPDEKRPNHGIFVRAQAVAISSQHEVVVISSKVNYDKFGLGAYELTESSFENVKEYRLVINRSLPIYNQINYFFISVRVAVTIARRFNPEVIHGNIGYPGGFWSWLVSKRIKRPFIITEHTFIYNNFRTLLHKKLTLFSLGKAAAIITVSKKAAMEIKRYVNREARIIPNIVEVGVYSITQYPAVPVAIGFLGGLSSPKHVKGLDRLMEALSKIKKEYVLHIGGTGVMMDQYQMLANRLGISARCKFLGFVPVNAVPVFMNQLHFFVNTSRFESFGIAIVEALASGLPVVCFHNGGPSDFVNQSNGVLVENQHPEKLKEAIEWMLENYQTYDRERIRASVSERFSREAFVSRMNLIYQEVNQ